MFQKLLISTILLSIFSLQLIAAKTHYVNTRTLKVRVEPTTASNHSYSIYKGYRVRVYETKGDWARISKYKTTVKNAQLVKIAKWVHGNYITKIAKKKTLIKAKKAKVIIKKPKLDIHPALLKAITRSDDFEKFKPTFISVSKKLFKDGICRIRDFKRGNGWMEIADDTIYFIYCGKIKRSNKIYLNVVTGEASK